MTAEGPAPGEQHSVTTGVGWIRGDVGNVVTGTYGPVHVNNWFGSYRVRRRTWELDVEQQRMLAKVFVRPPQWNDACSALRGDGIVLLHGEPGIGKRATALQLLFGLRTDETRPMHELQPDFDESEQNLLDPDDVDETSLLLLDLSAADAVASARALRELPAVVRTVRERNARLVVLLPEDRHGGWFPEWDPQSVRLDRPDNEEVLRLHLQQYQIDVPDPFPERLASELRSAEPSRVAMLARLAARTRSAVPGDDPAKWIEAARKATFDRAREAAQLVGQHTAAGTRALMLAAALFDGAPAAVVAEAERRFLAGIDHSAEPVPVIECADLGSRLTEIGGKVRPDGRVEFNGLKQAAALRAHFWTHFPLLHEHFRDWVGDCGDLMSQEEGDIAGRVPRFVDECLRVGRHQDVVHLVERWTDSRPTLPPALPGILLAYALGRPRHGWLFRRQCYRWATGRQASDRLADLVVTACRDVVAPTHPRQAIVRLRHLASHPHPAVADAARGALVNVLDGRAARLRYFLERSSTGREESRRTADARCFVTVVDAWLRDRPGHPRAMIGDAAVQAGVVARWHDVFALPADRWQPALRRWLAAGTTDPASSDRLLAVLVEATGCHPAHVANVENGARRWLAAADDPAADDVVRRLVTALDTAVVELALAAGDGTGRPKTAGRTETRGVPDDQAG